MKLLLSLIVLVGVLSIAQAAAPQITKTTCTVTKNDYTTYQTCTYTPPDPDNVRFRALMEDMQIQAPTPPPNYIMYSCIVNMDSMLYGGRVNVGFTANSASKTATVCSTYQCSASTNLNAATTWLKNHAENSTYDCYFNNDNLAQVFFDTAGFCSYNGVYNTTTAKCDCTSGFVGDACDNTHIEPGSNDTASLVIPTIVIVAMIAVFSLFM